jgi:hypothetical protein
MYSKYNYFIVSYDKNQTGISGLPFTIVDCTENDNLIFQMLRDIEFSFIKSEGDFVTMKIYAIEKGGSSFNKLNRFIHGQTTNSRVVELFSIEERFSKNVNNQWEFKLTDNDKLRFNVFDYKGKYFICNPMFDISKEKINSLLN